MDSTKFFTALNGNINKITIGGLVGTGDSKRISLKKETTLIFLDPNTKQDTLTIRFPASEKDDFKKTADLLKGIADFKKSDKYDPEYGCFALLVTPNGDKTHHLGVKDFIKYNVDSGKMQLDLVFDDSHTDILEDA